MKKWLPFFTATGVIVVVVALIEYVSLKKTGGHFCYPLDDTFIHMAIAKNLVLHGNWGINASGFTSTSSSPLFTLLLSIIFKVFSIHIIIPFVVSGLGTLLALFVMQREMNRNTALTTGSQVIVLLFVLLCGPLPALSLLGMEHTLQIAFTLLFVYSLASHLSGRPESAWWQPALLAALMTATRYENASFIVAAFLLLVLQKKFTKALLIGCAGALPLIIFGLYSVLKGGYFIPNSILIKGNQNFIYFLNGGNSVLQATASISGIIVIALVIIFARWQRQLTDRKFYVLTMLVIAGIMHSLFASFGWFYRYEAYLVVLGTFQLSVMALEWYQEQGAAGLRRQLLPALAIGVMLYSLPVRGLNANRNAVRAIYNIYEQQYQMGLFLSSHYPGQTVAANDVGAISFMDQLNVVDLWGLGNNEVARARKKGYWTNDFLQRLVRIHHTRVAVIYDSWFDQNLSAGWVKVATWEMPYNYICGDISVTFYAMNQEESSLLKDNLTAFATRLPADIKVAYFK